MLIVLLFLFDIVFLIPWCVILVFPTVSAVFRNGIVCRYCLRISSSVLLGIGLMVFFVVLVFLCCIGLLIESFFVEILLGIGRFDFFVCLSIDRVVRIVIGLCLLIVFFLLLCLENRLLVFRLLLHRCVD